MRACAHVCVRVFMCVCVCVRVGGCGCVWLCVYVFGEWVGVVCVGGWVYNPLLSLTNTVR